MGSQGLGHDAELNRCSTFIACVTIISASIVPVVSTKDRIDCEIVRWTMKIPSVFQLARSPHGCHTSMGSNFLIFYYTFIVTEFLNSQSDTRQKNTNLYLSFGNPGWLTRS